MGVQVWTNRRVKNVLPGGVEVDDEHLSASNIIWAAGVFASPLGRQLDAQVDLAGRVIVEPDLSVKEHPHIFVVGDLAAVADDKGKPVPGVAPAANQMGRKAAANVMAHVEGKETTPFRYVDKGNMATIGRAKAVVDLGFARFTGYFAWLVWSVVHIFYLISFRNRLLVMMQWAWSYFTYKRGTRLITGGSKPPQLQGPAETPPCRPQG